MKKTILTIALALGLTATAFAQTRIPAGSPATASTCSSECNRGNHAQGQCPNPFEGLELTVEQQTALDSLQAQCRHESHERGVRNHEAMQQQRRAMLESIKQILTPEQYVTFLENQFVNSGKKPQARPDVRNNVRREGNRRGAQRTAQPATQPAAN